MLNTKNFYEDQSDKTAAKIYFYDNYIREYLIKILMAYGKCIVLDLFCGQGMNGSKKGSPLVLLDNIDYLLPSVPLRKKHPQPEIRVIFNDCDKDNTLILNKELQKRASSKEIRIETSDENFSVLIKRILKDDEIKSAAPKFFFLDPYTYSLITTSELKKLLDLKNSEILLFLPTFHAYRFSSNKPPEKLKDFLNDFTEGGVKNYAGDFFDFIDSIRGRLMDVMQTSYVRPLVIEDKSSKNCLFLITKNISGMVTMNDLVWGTSGEMYGINLGKERRKSATVAQANLFSEEELKTIEEYQIKDISSLLTKVLKRPRTNKDLIELITVNLYRLTDANKALRNLVNEGVITTRTLSGHRKGCFYVNLNDDNRFKVKVIFRLKS